MTLSSADLAAIAAAVWPNSPGVLAKPTSSLASPGAGTAATMTPDARLEIDFTTGAGPLALSYRCADATNCWALSVQTQDGGYKPALFLQVAGSWSAVEYGSVIATGTHHVTIVVRGNRHEIFLDGATTADIDYIDTSNLFTEATAIAVDYDNTGLTTVTAWPLAVEAQIVFDGDSLTTGQGATDAAHTYPAVVGRAWTANAAVAGQRIDELLLTAPALVDALYVAGRVNVCVVWAGFNDLYESRSAVDTLADLVRYCRARRTAGFVVILATITPTDAAAAPAGFEAQRLALNAALRAGWATFADRLFDPGGATELSDPSNALYFDDDLLHLNDAGYAVVAGLAAAALTTALAVEAPTVADIVTAAWTAAGRTLTQTAAQIAAALTGTALTIQRGDSLSVSFTGLGNISTRTKLWLTVKVALANADAAALIQIEETAGLLYLNAAAGTAANGDITVTDATAGDVTVTLTAAETAKLKPASNIYYDVQMLSPSGVTTLTSGTANINEDVTRATA